MKNITPDPAPPETITQALYWLIEHQEEQPSLSALADHLEQSEAHIQKTFQTHAGLSPKQFLGQLTRERALARLRRGETVLDAALASGLSGPGRLHDLLIQTDAMTPGEARKRGGGVTLNYGTGQTPFGEALIAWSERGITFLGFCHGKGQSVVFDELSSQWPDARLQRTDQEAELKLSGIFSTADNKPLRLWLRGSPFQLKVWEALLAIPADHHASYGALAQHLGKPQASRAVGTAVGRNPIAWLIPCHRVITSSGALGGYRWGLAAKQLMIGSEASAGSQSQTV